jgi:mRNA-degrading endonuclease RelE of RelBE toxin-antitoxin system
MENEELGYNVIIDPAANDRMFDHYEFLARVSESAAEKLLDGLLEDIRSLEFMPYRNPVYDRPYLRSGKYRYMVSCGRYRIIYQIEGRTVYVDDIQDCRQSDESNLLFKPDR